MSDEEENPVATGLVALVAVAVVVGLLAGLAVLLGTRMLGLSGDTSLASDEPEAGATMYLPDPVATERAPDPEITLLPTETESSPPPSRKDSPSPKESETVDTDVVLNLNASPLSVEVGERIMLSGTYINGDASVLDIFRKVGDQRWQEFNLDVAVSGGVFQVYVDSYRAGVVKWQVRDPESGLKSEPVQVRYE